MVKICIFFVCEKYICNIHAGYCICSIYTKIWERRTNVREMSFKSLTTKEQNIIITIEFRNWRYSMGEIVTLMNKQAMVDMESEAEFVGAIKAVAFYDEQIRYSIIRQVYFSTDSKYRDFLDEFLIKNPALAVKYGLDTYSSKKAVK